MHKRIRLDRACLVVALLCLGLIGFLRFLPLSTPASQDRARRGPIAAAAAGGLAFDATSTSGSLGTTTSTFPHVVSGSNRLLLIFFHIASTTRTGLTVVYNTSESATFVDRQVGAQETVEIWQLIAPTAGTNNIVITATAGPPIFVYGIGFSFTGAHQTTPLGTPSKAASNTATPSVNVSSGATEIVADTMNMTAGATHTLTVGAGQTEKVNDVNQPDLMFGASIETGSGTTTMSWAIDSGGTALDTIIMAVAVKPA